MILNDNIITPTKGYFQLSIDFFELINKFRNTNKLSRANSLNMEIWSNQELFDIFDIICVDIFNLGIQKINYKINENNEFFIKLYE